VGRISPAGCFFYVLRKRIGIAEFAGLEFAGLEIDGLENDALENDALE